MTAAASGTALTYIAAGATRATGSGILVPSNSSIKSLQDLKGKKIAYTQGTSSQYLIIQALKKAGLSTSDVTLVNMKQPDAALAFAKGKVDAWVTWDPYTSEGQTTLGAKMLVDGEGLSNNRDFILASTQFAKNHKAVSKTLVKYLGADMKWANTHHSEVVKLLTKSLKMKKSVVEKMVARRNWTLTPMNDAITKEEQKIADTFYENGVIKKSVDVAKYVMK